MLTIYDSNGNRRTDIEAGDSSTQVKEVQGDNVLTLSFTHYEYIALDVNVKEGELLQAVTELYTEMERVSRYGFTEAEFGVVKADYERMVQRIFDSRDDRFNQNFTAVYRDNFLYNRPAMHAAGNRYTFRPADAASSRPHYP